MCLLLSGAKSSKIRSTFKEGIQGYRSKGFAFGKGSFINDDTYKRVKGISKKISDNFQDVCIGEGMKELKNWSDVIYG